MALRLRIGSGVSRRNWGSVDKSRIWRLLKQGIDEGVDGVSRAVREMYAVVKADVNGDLTQADCWGPHHELREDGTLVLNVNGLAAAAAALAGARAEPDLTDEEKEEARRHLLRHYRELELEPPKSLVGEMGSTAATAGEMARVEARVAGEVKPSDIPLAPGVDLEAIKAGDDDPLEVVVEIPPGRSTRGWNYRPEAIGEIVEHVNKETLPGYLGHQKPEDVGNEFPTPVTHWVGALWKDGKAYFRGVIDKSAADLKRWIRAKRVRQVSIFGMPQLQKVKGETHVVSFKPLSIDWTPLNRAGMPTRVVAVGEMDSTFGDTVGELDGSYDAIRELIQSEVRASLGKDSWAWVDRLFPTYAIVVVEEQGKARKLLRYPYVVTDGKLTLGQPVEVEEVRTYVEVSGEMRQFAGKRDGSHEDLRSALYQAAQAKFGADDAYVGVERVFNDTVIVWWERLGTRRLYAVPYTVSGNTVSLGDPTEVVVQERREYVPVVTGEMKKEAVDMGIKELLAAIRAALAKGETTVMQVLGEIGITKAQAIEAVAKDEWAKLEGDSKLAQVLKEALGLGDDVTAEQAKAVAGEMAAVWQALGFDKAKPTDPAKVVGEMAQTAAEAAKQAREAAIGKLIAEKVTGEQAQALVRRMLNVAEDATEEQIAGEIDRLLADEAVKGVLGKLYVDKPAGTAATSSTPSGDQRRYTATKRAAI